jgi:hypothetical protein
MLLLIAQGIRRPRALADVLEIELRTVHYYTQAAEWLALLRSDEHPQLTELGLTLAFADEQERQRVYAEAVWGNPFVQALFDSQDQLPRSEPLVAFIQHWEPQLSETTARRRASAVRALIEPALTQRTVKKTSQDSAQVDLPFLPTAPAEQPSHAQVSVAAGLEENPDVYAVLLNALLDCGELSTAQIRAILDANGAQNCSLAGGIAMVMRRGDGHRLGERIVISSGAIRRRELARDGILIALSDPLYRRHISLLTGRADPTGEQRRLARRFAPWDIHLFGAPLAPETHLKHLSTRLVGRRLDSIPIAGPTPAPFSPPDRPFIDALDVSDLLIAFPQVVTQLPAGVGAINPLLRVARHSPASIRLPNIVDERVACHGGLLYPGERLPRAIADNRSMRLRALTHCPVYAILAALLLLDRRRTLPLQIRHQGATADIFWRGSPLGGLLAALTAFSTAQGWQVARPMDDGPGTALSDKGLLSAAHASQIVQRAGPRLTVNEGLFMMLQEDLEARLSYEPLMALEDRIGAWLESLPA